MEKLLAALLAGITEGSTYGLIALGIVLVYKATRVLNFAQAEIGTIAVYIEWELWRLGVPVPFAILPALALAVAMGAGTEYILRPLANAARLTVTVATLGIATALGAFEVIVFKPDPHNAPRIVGGVLFSAANVEVTRGLALAFFVTAGLGVALYFFFKRTLFGLGVLAAAQDEKALRLMGLPLNRVSMFTWGAGALVTALAAIILAPVQGVFTPFFMTLLLVPGLAAALVGGLTSMPGAFVGGIAIGLVNNFAKFYFGEKVPGAEYVGIWLVMVAVLIFKPNGLLGAEA
jgi:branched-chain amino acid transport system permease protein